MPLGSAGTALCVDLHTQVVNESHTGKWVRDDMQIFSHSICLKKRASPGKRVSLSFSLSAVVMF